jgi:hypothetical protein
MHEQLQTALRSRSGSSNGKVPAGAGEARAEGEPRLLNLRRASFAAATAFLSVNLWTGSPLLALWVGSQAADERMLSMTSLFVVVITFAVLSLAISIALLWLEGRYRVLVGLPMREARLTWLRSFNAQREPVRQVPMSLLERIVTVVVYVAVILLLVWFIFFAGSPLSDYAQYA